MQNYDVLCKVKSLSDAYLEFLFHGSRNVEWVLIEDGKQQGEPLNFSEARKHIRINENHT